MGRPLGRLRDHRSQFRHKGSRRRVTNLARAHALAQTSYAGDRRPGQQDCAHRLGADGAWRTTELRPRRHERRVREAVGVWEGQKGGMAQQSVRRARGKPGMSRSASERATATMDPGPRTPYWPAACERPQSKGQTHGSTSTTCAHAIPNSSCILPGRPTGHSEWLHWRVVDTPAWAPIDDRNAFARALCPLPERRPSAYPTDGFARTDGTELKTGASLETQPSISSKVCMRRRDLILHSWRHSCSFAASAYAQRVYRFRLWSATIQESVQRTLDVFTELQELGLGQRIRSQGEISLGRR